MVGEFFVLIGCDFLAHSEGLYGHKTFACFVAGFNGGVELLVLHQSKIVGCHYYFNPIEPGGGGEDFGRILVGADAKVPYQFAFLRAFGPFLQFVC